jgi:UDP-glucuronate 4-epimerase
VAQFLRRGAAVRLPDQDAARNWLYSRDAAAALVGLALRRGPRHLVYNVAPSTTFPVRAWAQHLAAAVPGFTISPDGEELHFDADPSLPRVPVRNDRLRAELEGWPRFDSPRAFDDYLTWLRSHPDWT